MKLRAIVCVCLAGAAALRSPRKGVVGRDRSLTASSGDERSAGRAEVRGLDQREPKERVVNGVPVLTAAHCVDGPLEVKITSVVIGALDNKQWQCERWENDNGWYRPESIDVDDIVIPDKWYDNIYYNGGLNGPHDIALLHLARPSTLPPVKLAETSPAIDDGVLLLGWGDTVLGDAVQGSDILLRAGLKVMDNKWCFSFTDVIEFCAGDVSGKQNAGSGDSGGPLVIEHNGDYYQVGVTARADLNGYISIYGDVAFFRDWIDETMDNWEPKTCEDQSSDCDARCCPLGRGVHDLAWNHDGADKDYDGMKASCEAKGARLCMYDELCSIPTDITIPDSVIPNREMWAPILPGPGEGTQNWIFVKFSSFDFCKKHTDFVGKPHPSGSWWDSTDTVDHKGYYACCAGRCSSRDCNNSGRGDGGACVGHWSAENCRATCGLPCSETPESPEVEPSPKCEGAAAISASTGISIFEGRPDTPPEVCTDEITVYKFDDESGGEAQALLKFALSGRIGCDIFRAELRLRTINPSVGTIKAYRMTRSWDEDSTWNALGGGVGASDREADASFTIVAPEEDERVVLDVTEDVKFWLAGGANEGWAFLNSDDGGWSFASERDVRLRLFFYDETQCFDDLTTTDSRYYGCTAYTEQPEDCRFAVFLFNDQDFRASTQCCACGGGGSKPTGQCVNDDSTKDGGGFTCSSFYDIYPLFCGEYDNVDFTANVQCCACGGAGLPVDTPKPSCALSLPGPVDASRGNQVATVDTLQTYELTFTMKTDEDRMDGHRLSVIQFGDWNPYHGAPGIFLIDQRLHVTQSSSPSSSWTFPTATELTQGRTYEIKVVVENQEMTVSVDGSDVGTFRGGQAYSTTDVPVYISSPNWWAAKVTLSNICLKWKPTSEPTSEPTAKPMQKPTLCVDDPTYSYGPGKDCNHVAQLPDKRCYRNGGGTAEWSYKACCATCKDIAITCVDDSTTTDTGGNDCSWYAEDPMGPGSCGSFDDDDFTASEQCCACGGGVRETLTHSVGPKDASEDVSSKETLAVVISVIFAVCLAVGVVAALLFKRCFYPTKQADSSKPRKITIELPTTPSSGQAAAPAEDDEEQPDVITN